MINNVNSNFIAPEKPNNYFNQIDRLKKLPSQKTTKSDFQNLLTSNNKVQESSRGQQLNDGTDFALKKLSVDFEKQILGIMWNMAFQTNRKFEGGLGEEIFHQELVNEMVKLSKTGEMGDIASSIYKDLKRKENANRDEK